MKYPIFIISKGRAKPTACITARELKTMGIPFRIVVEPQEYEDYRKAFPDANIIKTPFSNLGQGSIPVRNFVWDIALEENSGRHWIIDDNIRRFHRLHENEKFIVKDGDGIFTAAETFTDRYENIGLSGMNYHTFCKKTDPVSPFNFNTRIYSCILIDNSLPFRWRGKYNEDTDLSLRVLKSGLCTVLFNAFLAQKMTTQKMKGGNTEEVYGNTNKRLEFAKSLEEQHPDVVKVVWKWNRWHHQVDYKGFTQKLIRKDLEPAERSEFGMVLVDK